MHIHTIALASCYTRLSLVANTERSLSQLDHPLSTASCERHLLSLDWSDQGSFLSSLLHHVQSVGNPALILVWLHDDYLGPKIAARIFC